MTIEKEPPGVWFLTCDGCQERVELDTDPDDSFRDAAIEAREKGWKAIAPQEKYSQWQNLCVPCAIELRRKTRQELGL